MKWLLIRYALVLGLVAFLVQWIRLAHWWHDPHGDAYLIWIAITFAILGAWVARRLLPKSTSIHSEARPPIAAVAMTKRELEVLHELAGGKSYKEIARALDLTPNTIKTHVSNIYRKLEVNRRTLALKKARAMCLIPAE